MPLLRRIFFYIFCAIYLVICPLIILRMLGFIPNWHTHELIKTGIIYISSNPPGATVYIDNLQANETTPTIIRDLYPGHYTVHLELKDYQSRQNTVPIVGRKATVVENILLIPKQWTVKPLSNLPFENISPVGDGNTLLAWQEKTIKNLYLLRLNKEAATENTAEADVSQVVAVFPPESIYNEAPIIRFFTVDKSPFFVLHILVKDKPKYLWVDVRDKQTHIEDISDLLLQEPLKLWWEPGDEKIIYAFFNDHVNRLDIKAKAIYPSIPSKDIPLKQEPSPNQMEGQGKMSDENNDMWLEFTPHTIGLWDKTEKTMQWIFEKGNNITQSFWANHSSAILFHDGHQVFLMDRENFDQTQLQKVTSVDQASSIYYSEKTGKLYYIEPVNHLLCAIQILRHKPTLPKTIADTLRLKKFER